MSRTTRQADHDRRSNALREELERRLALLEQAEESTVGPFTALDWLLCTLLFFALPLLILGLAAL